MRKKLSELKVGDPIWTIQDGWISVTSMDDSVQYPIKVYTDETYTIDGHVERNDAHPSAFTYNPLEVSPEQGITEATEVLMEVSDDGENWVPRVVFMKKNNFFVAWDGAETIQKAKFCSKTHAWLYAQDLKPKVKLSQSEAIKLIAEMKGLPIDQIQIQLDL